jgi:uncharacterized protein (TIGR02147 family)
MNTVFHYLDYQEYLRDYYREKKGENYFFSYRFMGRQVNLDPGFLVKVLQGKNHISIKTIPAFIQLCKMNEKEAEYFKNLVFFGKSKLGTETKRLFKKLLEIQGKDVVDVKKSQYVFYNKWYHSAIRSLIGIKGFKGNYRNLANSLSPKISVDEAKESVQLLKKLGFIQEDKDGYYSLIHKNITTSDRWKSLAVKLFQADTIGLAKESLDRHLKDIRDISTMTIGIAPEDIDEIKELAKEFRQSILKIKSGNSKASCVYQVNIQIFPLTKVEKRKYE